MEVQFRHRRQPAGILDRNADDGALDTARPERFAGGTGSDRAKLESLDVPDHEYWSGSLSDDPGRDVTQDVFDERRLTLADDEDIVVVRGINDVVDRRSAVGSHRTDALRVDAGAFKLVGRPLKEEFCGAGILFVLDYGVKQRHRGITFVEERPDDRQDAVEVDVAPDGDQHALDDTDGRRNDDNLAGVVVGHPIDRGRPVACEDNQRFDSALRIRELRGDGLNPLDGLSLVFLLHLFWRGLIRYRVPPDENDLRGPQQAQ